MDKGIDLSAKTRSQKKLDQSKPQGKAIDLFERRVGARGRGAFTGEKGQFRKEEEDRNSRQEVKGDHGGGQVGGDHQRA